MLAHYSLVPGDIIRRRIAPFVFVRQHEGEVLCVIIPVAGDNIEDHAPEQFHLLRMRMCEQSAKFDEFPVFEVGGPEVRVQQAGHAMHMMAMVAGGPVKSARQEVSVAVPRLRKSCFSHIDAGMAGHGRIDMLYGSFRLFIGRPAGRKLGQPMRIARRQVTCALNRRITA